MKWTFAGGASEVTGSRHLLEVGGARVLFDCGLFQGKRQESEAVNSDLGFDAGSVDAVVVSHAHIDHCGCLPRLAKLGYRGDIRTTVATGDLLPVMLRDAAMIQESDAAYLNQKTNRKGMAPVTPLFTLEDAEAALRLVRRHEYHEPVDLPGGVRMWHYEAGHILGAGLARLEIPREGGGTMKVGLGVDLGRRGLPLLRDPERLGEPGELDVLILESTYGDRLHDNATGAAEGLREAIAPVLERGGKALIPCFALERTQEVIYHLTMLFEMGDLPRVPVHVDSPMAAEVSKIFEKHHAYWDEASIALREKTGESLMAPSWLNFASSVDESKAITASSEPAIVLATAGMCEHGRILHHLKHGISNEKNLVLLVGYQAVNTLGRRLQNGEKKVRIFGDMFDVKAEVQTLKAFSAHADRLELYRYVRDLRPKTLVLVHGEQKQRESFGTLVRERLKIPVFLPNNGDVVDLEGWAAG